MNRFGRLMLRSTVSKMAITPRLGILNVMRIALYRIALKSRLHPVQRIRRTLQSGPYFNAAHRTPPASPSNSWLDRMLLFGSHCVPLDSEPPDWRTNPLSGAIVTEASLPWWRIPDFQTAAGDIKTVWEPSRFAWALAFAQRGEIQRLNHWLSDWCTANPAFYGPNWKCGQEASIRVLHLAATALLLGTHRSPRGELQALVEAHLARIEPTVSYAIAQDNNHGTSEAAALFVGGLLCADPLQTEVGRVMLEERVEHLIAADGSFGQYSVNYHRLVLDTLSLVEVWRRACGLEPFSHEFVSRARAAARWLYALVDPFSGDAPNLGANDGALLLPLTDAPFRDHRPSVQLAFALFCGKNAYPGPGNHEKHLRWLGVVPSAEAAAPPGTESFDDGGLSVLRQGDWAVAFRYPRYRFRPRQCDALHVDLWHGPENVLRDAGTYSYNSEPEMLAYFPGTGAHNTVQFDDREQMPRVGRFLLGAWLNADEVQLATEQDGVARSAAGYSDSTGATHRRELSLDVCGLTVTDHVGGFKRRAVLRWRLTPGDWQIDGDAVSSGDRTLTVTADTPVVRREIVQGWESRHYLERNSLPVLEVEVDRPAKLTTVVR